MQNETVDAQRPPRVFLSYSHDSEPHRERVLQLANRLREEGVDARLDRYIESPAYGWIRWMEQQVQAADFVLVVCTPSYRRRFEGKEDAGKGLGVNFEGATLQKLIYAAEQRNEKYVPVLFEDGTDAVPLQLGDVMWYRLPDDYDALYRRITSQPEVVAPPLGAKRNRPSRGSKESPDGTFAAVRRMPASLPSMEISPGPPVLRDVHTVVGASSTGPVGLDQKSRVSPEPSKLPRLDQGGLGAVGGQIPRHRSRWLAFLSGILFVTAGVGAWQVWPSQRAATARERGLAAMPMPPLEGAGREGKPATEAETQSQPSSERNEPRQGDGLPARVSTVEPSHDGARVSNATVHASLPFTIFTGTNGGSYAVHGQALGKFFGARVEPTGGGIDNCGRLFRGRNDNDLAFGYAGLHMLDPDWYPENRSCRYVQAVAPLYTEWLHILARRSFLEQNQIKDYSLEALLSANPNIQLGPTGSSTAIIARRVLEAAKALNRSGHYHVIEQPAADFYVELRQLKGRIADVAFAVSSANYEALEKEFGSDDHPRTLSPAEERLCLLSISPQLAGVLFDPAGNTAIRGESSATLYRKELLCGGPSLYALKSAAVLLAAGKKLSDGVGRRTVAEVLKRVLAPESELRQLVQGALTCPEARAIMALRQLGASAAQFELWTELVDSKCTVRR